MADDDDINYTILGLHYLEEYGLGFRSAVFTHGGIWVNLAGRDPEGIVLRNQSEIHNRQSEKERENGNRSW